MATQTTRRAHPRAVPYPQVETVPPALPQGSPSLRAVRTAGASGRPQDTRTATPGTILERQQPPKPLPEVPSEQASDGGLKKTVGGRGGHKTNADKCFTGNIEIFSRGSKQKGEPIATEQERRYLEIVKEWGNEEDLTYPQKARIRLLATIEVELERLQAFVNQHGPTYIVRGKSGDSYTRARPEYQQLQEARTKYTVLLDRLSASQNSETSLDGFLAP